MLLNENKGIRWWIVFFMAMVSLGCTVYLIIWKKSPEGQEEERRFQAIESKELDLKLAKEKTKQMRLQAQLQARNRDHSTSAPIQVASLSPTSCINPDQAGSKRSAPIIAESGGCLTREHGTAIFWMEFKSVPRNTEGVIWYDHVTFREGEDGKQYPVSMGRCYGDLADDKCMSFLQSKLGVPLLVSNKGPIRIEL